MGFQSFIDDYMQKNGSADDPVKNKKAKHACAEYIAAALKLAPEGIAAPNAKESTMGDVYKYLGFPEDALFYYDAALKIVPYDYKVIYSKIHVLLKDKDKHKAVDYIESILNEQNLPNKEVPHNIYISYLAALSESDQITSSKYIKTLNYMLDNHDTNIYTHVYAARYHDFNNKSGKFLEHLAKIVELTRDDEAKNGDFGYHEETVAIIANATQTAIQHGDKYKTWLFIAHLMNSNYDNSAILKLREAATKAFPKNEKSSFDNSL